MYLENHLKELQSFFIITCNFHLKDKFCLKGMIDFGRQRLNNIIWNVSACTPFHLTHVFKNNETIFQVLGSIEIPSFSTHPRYAIDLQFDL